MANDSKALVLTRPMIARDLDNAGKGQLVYVGRDGDVRDPASVRSRQAAAYAVFGGITAAGVALAATSFPLLVPFYVVLGGRFLGTVRAVGRVNEASVALHRSLGFELRGTLVRLGYKRGEWRDVSYWERLTGPADDSPPTPIRPVRTISLTRLSSPSTPPAATSIR